MLRFFLFILVIPGVISCKKMERGKIYSAEKEFYDDGTNRAGLFFLRKLQNNTVYDSEESKFYKIVIPSSFKNGKIAWGNTYFTGMRRKSTRPEIFYLIADYEDSVCHIVFDKNGNRDFTDDSITIINPRKPVDVVINNHFDKKASVKLKFSFRQGNGDSVDNKISKARDSAYEKLYKVFTHKRKDGIGPGFISNDAELCYRKVHLPDGNIITLYDFNVNGVFNDRYDKIIAGDIAEKLRIRHDMKKTRYVRWGTELPFSNTTFKLVEVDRYGNSVELIDLKKKSDTAEILQSFEYLNEKSQRSRFNFFSKKEFTVLYIWGSWCIGCWTQGSRFVELMKENDPVADYYAFNCGDKIENMNNYLSKKRPPFKAWRLDNSNVPKLNPDGFPHYIVIDKQRRVLFRSTSVHELDSFFKKELLTKRH